MSHAFLLFAWQVDIFACECDKEFYTIATNSTVECAVCPVGAVCPNGACALSNAQPVCEGQKRVAGTWTKQANGRFVLQSCPRGHELRNTDHDLMACNRCADGYFVADSTSPAARCQRCPQGFKCVGGGPPSDNPVVSAVVQLRGPASLGELSADDVSELLGEILGEAMAGSDVNLEVQSNGASTVATRRATTQISLDVAMVSDTLSTETLQELLSSPAVTASVATLMAERGYDVEVGVGVGGQVPEAPIGEYVIRNGQLTIIGCPTGYLLVNSSTEAQGCTRCDVGFYSFDHIDGCAGGSCPVRACNKCPAGAVCDYREPEPFRSLVAGAEWVLTQEANYLRNRVSKCPPGHVLARGNDPDSDQCIDCPIGKYSVAEAVFPSTLATADLVGATDMCIPCPANADCQGRNLMEPDPGFWIHEHDRALVNASAVPASGGPRNVTVYRCGLNACKGGNQSECESGRMGPICGEPMRW
eukprot:3936872-Rhodomonas_salina.9